ncbi:DAK2 domain-containing protein [Paenibacillus sp. 1P07SE]|uniref:DAK2 domain-containing protein n=1 Tax=Paenibacillus sp. 1P07SE TaxID=3132209 RepID=UPI0039A4AE61
MINRGADCLQLHAEHVNALNVFPVPDGDTGTNMNLTMTAGRQELLSKPSESLAKASEVLSKGLLLGARGNSGVILSQLFRGFARGSASLDQMNSMQFAEALQHGVNLAYKAVVKPVEGTILTVAKEAAKHATKQARRVRDIAELMREVHAKAQEALERTPDLLPVLKQVGVVDSGGQGLVYIYEGFLAALEDSALAEPDLVPKAGFAPAAAARPAFGGSAAVAPPSSAQSRLETKDIEFLYDMEFFINRQLGGGGARRFDETAFKQALAKDGDSIVVIADEEIIKVHVHSRKPGDVLNLSLPYGELSDIHILNMRDQHRELIHDGTVFDEREAPHTAPLTPISADEQHLADALPELLSGVPAVSEPPAEVHEMAPYGIIAVAIGQGISDIFLNNNVDVVLSGGQTMNPSTEDFVQAMAGLTAGHIFLLPNNGNIILTAQQAAELSDRQVTVIPTKTIPQGLAALLAFKDQESPERNAASMQAAVEQVQSGQVTHAVRDSVIDGLQIREGHYIGIREKQIVSTDASLLHTCQALLDLMIGEGGELVTVLTGEQAQEHVTEELSAWIHAAHPDVELEIHSGGQPLYPYLFAVE